MRPTTVPFRAPARVETSRPAERPIGEYPDDPDLIGQILRPYRPHCQYLVSARTWVRVGAVGEPARVGVDCDFEIPESCYIDDTGHFNSVEFNICYNQMLYFLLAKMVKESLVGPFSAWSMEDFWARQLPDVLITDFRSAFRTPMAGGRFRGFLEITEITEWERNDLRDALIVLRTECGYSDDRHGDCDGEVTVAITNPPVGDRAPGPATAAEPAPSSGAASLLAALPRAERRDGLLELVAGEIRGALLMEPTDALAPDANYFELGLTSLHVMEIKQRLERQLDRDIESALLFNHPSLDAFVDRLTTGVLADLFPTDPAPDRPGPAPTARRTLVDQLLNDLYPAG